MPLRHKGRQLLDDEFLPRFQSVQPLGQSILAAPTDLSLRAWLLSGHFFSIVLEMFRSPYISQFGRPRKSKAGKLGRTSKYWPGLPD
jgi:hypothetical protein